MALFPCMEQIPWILIKNANHSFLQKAAEWAALVPNISTTSLFLLALSWASDFYEVPYKFSWAGTQFYQMLISLFPILKEGKVSA